MTRLFAILFASARELACGRSQAQVRNAALLRAYRNWGGPLDATCGSTSGGAQAMSIAFAETRPNLSHLRQTSSWPPALDPRATAAGDSRGAPRPGQPLGGGRAAPKLALGCRRCVRRRARWSERGVRWPTTPRGPIEPQRLFFARWQTFTFVTYHHGCEARTVRKDPRSPYWHYDFQGQRPPLLWLDESLHRARRRSGRARRARASAKRSHPAAKAKLKTGMWKSTRQCLKARIGTATKQDLKSKRLAHHSIQIPSSNYRTRGAMHWR
jgi:hypothetical protein